MKPQQTWEKDGFLLRPFRPEDAIPYYEENFCPLEPEIARLTGSRTDFSREEVLSFFTASLQREDHFDFLLVAPDGRRIGEGVLNEIDFRLRCANFRICLFHQRDCGKGLGFWMVRVIRDFAFEVLGLHRLELEVFSFNPRAQAVYRKAGFRVEGVRRDAVLDGQAYADAIEMAILEEEWRALKAL